MYFTCSLWKYLKTLCFLYCMICGASGSTIHFQASSSTIQPSTTPSLTLRCSLNDLDSPPSPVVGKRDVTTTTEDLQHVTAILLTRGDQDVASVSQYAPARAFSGRGNVRVSGHVSGARGERAYLEITWDHPTESEVGAYKCEVDGVDDFGRTTVFSKSLVITSSAPKNSSCVGVQNSRLQQLLSQSNGLQAACDMHTDGGNWVIIQRRTKGGLNFTRNWAEYSKGFGDVTGDFWFGLDNIFFLCNKDNPCEFRVDIMFPGAPAYEHLDLPGADKDQEVPRQPDGHYYAKYSHFSISGQSKNYILNIAGYSGTAGDCLTERHQSNNGSSFSTYDRDNDGSAELGYGNVCAIRESGGWWYTPMCGWSGLNGDNSMYTWTSLTSIGDVLDLSEIRVRSKSG